MAGRNMAANLGMNIDWRLKDPGMFNRGIENFSRPDADPTDMEQMQGLLNWQQKMGREDAARTTMAQVEKLKAEQTTADNLKAAQRQAGIRNNMDRIARDEFMSPEQKQIALNGLQAQLNTLTTTDQQVALNSGYGLKTLNAADEEQRRKNQEERAAESMDMQRAREDAARTERERVANEQAALNQLATLDPADWDAHIKANPNHAAVLSNQVSVMKEREYRDAQASEYFNRMAEGPDEDWIEKNFDADELDEKGQNLLKAVNSTKGKYVNGTWTTDEARTFHMNAVRALNDHINSVAQAEAERVRAIDNAMMAQRVELESRINRPDVSAVQQQLNAMIDEDKFSKLSRGKQEEYVAAAISRASVLVNRDVYMGLANNRISQDPTKTQESELPEGYNLRAFDDFRRGRIAQNRGMEPGGEEETLKLFKKQAADYERREAEAAKRPSYFVSPEEAENAAPRTFANDGPPALSKLLSPPRGSIYENSAIMQYFLQDE